MMKRWLYSATFVCMMLSLAARADDDLMNLMGSQANSPSDEVSVAEPSAVRKTLEKAIGKLSAEQTIFVQFIEKNDFERALYQWPSAFDGSEFSKSENGVALNAFLLLKNGTPIYALEQLLAIENPEKVAETLRGWWKDAAPVTHSAWSHVNPRVWKAAWSKVFGPEVEGRLLAQKTFTFTELGELKELSRKAPKDSMERAWLEWQSILANATDGDAAIAARSLSILMKAPNNPVSQDLMTLTAARLLYQNGYLDAAVKYYEKVPKASDDWFDAQEEMAWAMVRKGEPQNAIAVTKSLMLPAFQHLVGPESVFVRAIALLKVCDYPEVGKTLDAFRDRYRERAKNMIALSETGRSAEVETYIVKAKKTKANLKDLGASAAKLPRFITRDELLTRALGSEKALEQEAAKFGELYVRSLSQGTGQVGFQGRLETLKKDLDARVQSARSASYARVKAMAESEINEIAQTLQKMHVVEAEVLQQISLSDRVVAATSKSAVDVKKGTTGSRGKDRLVWPNEKETWFDEVANYQIDLKKGCQSVTK